MRMMPLVLMLFMAAAPAPPAAQDPASAGDRAAESPRAQRAIIRVNRNQEVKGHIKLEDQDIIVIQTLAGPVESYSKGRVLQIVRLVDPEPGQTGTVILSDGQTREGIIVEDAFEYVLMEIEGIRAKLRRDAVSHVLLSPTVEQRYAEFKAQLQPGMYDAQLVLCRWLVEQRRYDLAKRELDDLLAHSELADARKLLTLVEAQLALREAPPRGAAAPAGPNPSQPPAKRSGPVRAEDILPDQLISADDVNLIRVYEIDFDHLTRLTITPDTVRELLEKYGASDLVPSSQTGRNALFRAAADRPLDVVRLMFELRARELYPKIRVNSEPYALNLFRQRVHDTWLVNSCATNHCHGGLEAGRFFLHRRNFKDDRVRYTNLLILERLQLDPQWPLINYEDPEKSLIVQYGLPRELARKPHPAVPGWKPVFTKLNQRLLDGTFEWIKSMMQPRPEYPVDYQPPQLSEAPPAEPVDGGSRPPR